METALSEITLVIFTTITPAGVMGFSLLALAILWTKDEAEAKRMSNFLAFPLALSMVGFICSATHLGTPANALYVVTGVGRSPLSNEVVSAICFLGLSGVIWMLSFGHYRRSRMTRIALIISATLGFICIYFISRAYSVPTIPTWNLPTAPLTLWMNALVSGPVVTLLSFLGANILPPKKYIHIMCGLSAVAVIVNVILLGVQYSLLTDISTVSKDAVSLVPYAPLFIAVSAICGLAGNGVEVITVTHRYFAMLAKRQRLLTFGITGLLLVLLSCFIVRFMFYSMYMTWGL